MSNNQEKDNRTKEEVRAKNNIKDSVFTDLFADTKYTLQLYKALHPEDKSDVTEKDVKIVTLQNVLVHQQYNDLGFTVRNKLLIFVEAQSTWSVNILVRGLEYMVQTIQQHILDTDQNPYASPRLKFPMPEFFVLYTGERKDRPEELKLSTEFFDGAPAALEVTAKLVYDGEEGDILNQYVTFAQVFTDQIRKHGKSISAIQETIQICKKKNVLAEYLKSREKEVISIMKSLFDKEYIMDLFGREKKAEGIAEERARSVKKLAAMDWSIEKIAAFLEITPRTVQDLLETKPA